ncbi:TetR/AcrR family transcriptional regulator [Pseudonocardia adelaidensis]
MTDTPVEGRVARRRRAAMEEVLATAWQLAAEEGLAAISLRELASRLAMRPQSLAWYVPSKNALYDRMYAQGHRQFLERLAAEEPLDVERAARLFADFCVASPPRYQLIAQRTLPGFTPSAESAALARRAFGAWRAALAAAGVTGHEAVDVLTAVVKGLVDQQITVDPAGDRFLRHLDDVIDMFLAHTAGTRP